MRPVEWADAECVRLEEYRGYIAHFVNASHDVERVMESFGVPLESERESRSARAESRRLKAELAQEGALIRNDGKSVVHGPISPACERCRTGVRSVSEFISLACRRSCWFCFNPNQCDYELYRSSKKDWLSELDCFERQMGGLDFVALTGGEPLLFADEACAFFETARSRNPAAHLRLYTSGDGLDAGMLSRLTGSGLDEIRFSVKLDDDAVALDRLWRLIDRAVESVDAVMVEMPVVPGTRRQMEGVIRRLGEAGAFGINLLELCFPLHNAKAYRSRGLKLVRRPYRIPYDYGYAGALPVAGSEQLALELMLDAVRQRTELGIHYCSLENKNTAQIFGQNRGGVLDVPHYRFSNRTFFYETVRVFGADARVAASALEGAGAPHADDGVGEMVMFSPAFLDALDGMLPDLRLFLASAVIEPGEGGASLFREVGLQVVEPGDLAVLASNGGDEAPC